MVKIAAKSQDISWFQNTNKTIKIFYIFTEK